MTALLSSSDHVPPRCSASSISPIVHSGSLSTSKPSMSNRTAGIAAEPMSCVAVSAPLGYGACDVRDRRTTARGEGAWPATRRSSSAPTAHRRRSVPSSARRPSPATPARRSSSPRPTSRSPSATGPAQAQELGDAAYKVMGANPAEDALTRGQGTRDEGRRQEDRDGRRGRRPGRRAGRADRRTQGRPVHRRQPRPEQPRGPAARLGPREHQPPASCDVLIVHTTGGGRDVERPVSARVRSRAYPGSVTVSPRHRSEARDDRGVRGLERRRGRGDRTRSSTSSASGRSSRSRRSTRRTTTTTRSTVRRFGWSTA